MMSTQQTTEDLPDDQPDSPPTMPPDPESLPTPLPPAALQRNWYRFVTDKIAGPNIRLFDNLFSLGSAILGIIVGDHRDVLRGDTVFRASDLGLASVRSTWWSAALRA